MAPPGGRDYALAVETPDYSLHAGFIVVYLLALIGVGALKARKIKSQEDFALAGRGLPGWVLVGTLLATWIGTGSIFGNAQKAYQIGVPALMIPVAGAAGIVALFFLAARIRRFGQFTIQDILEARFGVWARVLSTIALLGAYIIIVSYQYRAGSAVLERVVPDLEGAYAVYAVAAFVIVYTALAGMFSVAYTDVANGIMMTIGIAIAIPILWSKAGGWEGAVASLGEGRGEVTDYWDTVKLLGVLMPAFLLMLGDANMYQRFFSAKDVASARRSAVGMLVGVIALEVAIILVALLSTALVAQGELAVPENPGHIIVVAAFDALPAVVGAMLIATVVAVVVSTADSYLLAPSSSLVRDVYQRFINPNAEPGKVVFLSRLFVVILGLVALGLAFTSDAFFEVSLFAYTIYGCAITPCMLAAFFWKRANAAGAVASIVVGAVVALFWETIKFLQGQGAAWAQSAVETLHANELEAVLVAFPLSVIALVGVSLATAPPPAEKANAI